MSKKLTENALTLLKNRYLNRDNDGNVIETPQQMFRRVAKVIASVEKEIDKQDKYEKEFLNIMQNLDFIPNSPCLMNAGLNSNLFACFVVPIEDSIESIMQCAYNVSKIFTSGGGCGVNFSPLRPQDDIIQSSKGKSSGPLSFMEIFDKITEVIKQGGRRKGALMGLLNCNHPDIFEFIDIKNDLTKLTNFNLSVAITDKFMEIKDKETVEERQFPLINPKNKQVVKYIDAKELWDKICQNAWDTGEPGIVFIDTVNKYNYMKEYELITATNPCIVGDTLIAVADGRRAVSIKQLYEENKSDTPVYSYNIEKKRNEIKYARNIRITKTNADVLKLTLENGFEIIATPNHNFILDDGTIKELKDLVSGDRLLPFRLNLNNYKYNHIVKNIEPCGTQDVYNMEVLDNHNYFAVNKDGIGICIKNCAEQPLLPYCSCVLGSINLSNCYNENEKCFDENKLIRLIRLGVRFLDNTIDASIYPIKEIEEKTKKLRNIGLGIMGFADLLYKMKIEYGSKESLELAERITYLMKIHSYAYSELLAKEKGAFELLDKSVDIDIPRRNCNTTTCAPTGSISIIANCSSGIEPHFALAYNRQTIEGNMTFSNELFIEELKKYGYSNKQIKKIIEKVINNNGSCKGIEEVPQYIQNIFVVASDIMPILHIRMQAAFQKNIDSAISKTINMPEDATIEDVKNVYDLSWKLQCKGTTIFRNHCKRMGVLTTGKKETEKCPECGKELINTGKCTKCSDESCGWTKCNI